MTNAQRAYLAGLIDGEGTVSLSGPKKGDGTTGYFVRPFVQFANTNELLVQWIRDNVDTPFGEYYYNRHPERQKPAWLIHWRGLDGVRLLKEILPFMVGKKLQAQIVIDTWEGEAAWNQNKRGRWCKKNPMPLEVATCRQNAYNQIRALNRKGPTSKETQ